MPASNARISPDAKPLERELTLTRIFDAPRELVFQAWTDPAHLKRWWGPNGFTTPACDVDLRIGGTWRIVMRFPDGINEHIMHAVYREIVRPERLSFTNVATDKEGTRLLEGITTITLEDLGGKTKLTMHTRMTGLVPYADRMLDGMEPGWSQTLERLAEALAQTEGGSKS
jgi:uncharacterized protein YndB with AHSA1/START domain